jgi:molybdopterin-guanine dinucleotide biosynthesis protein B
VAAKRAAILGIAGWKNSGKTTLIERLIPELKARGLKVATVKHSHHTLRARDGHTDGERHAEAGAAGVIVIGADGWELSGERQPGAPPSLEEAAGIFDGVDLILAEGFKSAPIAKIEVQGPRPERALAPGDERVLAVASDRHDTTSGVPTFARDDIAGLAQFIASALAYLRETS